MFSFLWLYRSFFVPIPESIKYAYLNIGFKWFNAENLRKKGCEQIQSKFYIKIFIEKNINTISILMNIKISSFPVSFFGVLEPFPSKESLQIFEAIIGIKINFQ